MRVGEPVEEQVLLFRLVDIVPLAGQQRKRRADEVGSLSLGPLREHRALGCVLGEDVPPAGLVEEVLPARVAQHLDQRRQRVLRFRDEVLE